MISMWKKNLFYWRGKRIGFRVSKQKFVMPKKRKHIFRKYESIGCEKEILIDLIKNGIRTIEIELEGDRFLVSPLEWLKSELEFEFNGMIQKHVKLKDLRRME